MDKQNKTGVPATLKDNEQTGGKNNSRTRAGQEASRDIAADPDLSIHSPNDDLDEGELARLGENGNPVE